MIISLQVSPKALAFQASHKTSSKPANPNPNSSTHFQIIEGLTPLRTRILSAPLPTNLGSDSGLIFREKLVYLERLNIDSTKVLRLNPNFRVASLKSVKYVEKCLYNMGIARSEIGRILDMYPQLLTCDPYNDLYPVFDFLLNDVKIPFVDIRKSIIRCPRLLVSGVRDRLKPTLDYLHELGFVGRNAITCHTTLLLVSSVEDTLKPKVQYLQSLGFSFGETVNMVLRSPGLLTFSITSNFEPKMKYFLNEMKGDLIELKWFPHYFSFSLEKKIKPRHRLLVKHGLTLPLSEMLKISDGEFDLRLPLQCLDDKFSL